MKALTRSAFALSAVLFAGGCGGPESDLPDDQAQISGALCSVTTNKELMINGLSVVEDPVRTAAGGAWTFGKLMTSMAGPMQDPSDFVLSFFKTWETNRTVNGLTVLARPGIDTLLLNSWPKLANGKLNLNKAPLRLLAIVNRFDLRKLSQGNAGEGRFVFGVLDSAGNPTSFTVILEYKLPAATAADVQQWANDWHALGAIAFPSAVYNTALQKLTDRFAGAGVAPAKPNGSSISQVRTNEIAIGQPWELREFHLSANTGKLIETTVALTPADSLNNTATLAQYINANQTQIIAGKHVVPLQLNAAPFRGAASLNNIDFWRAPGVNAQARHVFSLNTCDGCHGRETNTGFLQVSPRAKGQVAGLSGFLTGTSVVDPVVPGTTRTFNDLARRSADLSTFVCPAPGVVAALDSDTDRVH